MDSCSHFGFGRIGWTRPRAGATPARSHGDLETFFNESRSSAEKAVEIHARNSEVNFGVCLPSVTGPFH